MLFNLTDKLLDSQIKNNKIEESDRELYQYGYNLLILQCLNFSVLVLISLLFHCLIYMALFAVVYIPLRSYAGGYHASTPIGCAIFSAILELVIAATLRFSLFNFLLPGMFALTFVAQIIIWLNAPIEAVHKPLGDGQKQKFRKITRTILLIEAAVLIVLCMKNHHSPAGFVIGISHIILAMMMLLPQKE
ncbi:MAG: accessory gene regulator B family protein [Hungatella hathewayi]|nr:accessory gene regulator B family protein [Hungatella hathewayi]